MFVRSLLALRLVVGLLAATCALASALAAPPKNAAQKNAAPKNAAPKNAAPKPVGIGGVVQSVESKQFEVLVDVKKNKKQAKNKKNGGEPPKTRTVFLQGTTKFKVSGYAKSDYLSAGQMIEFQGDLDSTLFASELKELAVLPPSARTTSDASKAAKVADDPSGLTEALPKSVVARLHERKEGNKWTVRAGSKTAEIDVAKDAKITVILPDIRRMNVGDRVFVQGTTVPGKPNQCTAESVTVTLATPLVPKPQPQPSKRD